MDGMTFRRAGNAMMLAAGCSFGGVLLVAGALAGVASLIGAVVIVIVITLLLLYVGVFRERRLAGAAPPGVLFRGAGAVGLSESLPPGMWEAVFGGAKTGGIADGSGWAAGVVEISRSALTWTPEPSTARAGVRLLQVPITSVRGARVSPHGGVQLDLLDGGSLVINVNRLNDAMSVLRGLVDANEGLR